MINNKESMKIICELCKSDLIIKSFSVDYRKGVMLLFFCQKCKFFVEINIENMLS